MPCSQVKSPVIDTSRINTSPSCSEYSNSRRNGCLKQQETGMKLQDSSLKKLCVDPNRNITNGEALQLFQNLETGKLVLSDIVKKNQDTIIHLPKNEFNNCMNMRICGLDGTLYSGEEYELESWGELYLPDPTRMEVLGILESLEGMVPFPQWIILVGENGHVYGFYDERLHFFAYSLKELLQEGIKNTGITYSYPDDLSDEEEEVLQNDEKIQKIRQKTREFIDKDADEFDAFLKLF